MSEHGRKSVISKGFTSYVKCIEKNEFYCLSEIETAYQLS